MLTADRLRGQDAKGYTADLEKKDQSMWSQTFRVGEFRDVDATEGPPDV